jgi:energy-coupling factor transporter ATP-binding protein EcfA2
VPPHELPVFRARNLAFGYTPGRSVLEVADFEVFRGSITAVIGSNGCGKTTLFKVLNGLLGPYTGSVLFHGREITAPGGRRQMRRLSIYVHQKPYAFRERVAENVAYGLKVRKVPREQHSRRIEESLRAVGMEHLSHRQAQSLSGGERQRLAVARALALHPEVILLDEPTSNIDPESVRLIEKAVLDAQSKGTTVLLSTHNLATAYRIATTVLPMEDGNLDTDRNNVYHGAIGETGDSLGRFAIAGGGAISVPSQEGPFTAAVVPMDDVILSRQKLVSSAQNQFSGPVTEVVPIGNLYRVRLACPFPLDALVTDRAVEQLEIAPGKALHAGFKASAVRLY